MNFWNRALAEFGRTWLPSLRLGRAQVCYYTRRTHDRESRMPSSVVAGSGGKARKVGGRRLPVASNHLRGCAELPSRPTQTLSHHLGSLLHPADTEVRLVCSNSEPRILEYLSTHTVIKRSPSGTASCMAHERRAVNEAERPTDVSRSRPVPLVQPTVAAQGRSDIWTCIYGRTTRCINL